MIRSGASIGYTALTQTVRMVGQIARISADAKNAVFETKE